MRRAFAVFHDSGDVKIVVQQPERAIHGYMLGLGRPVIQQNIVRALHVMAFEKDESAGNVAKRLADRSRK